MWRGIYTYTKIRCRCGLTPCCRVAFEGTNLGRRFLGCNYERAKCSFVHWFDPPHPLLLQHSIMALWWEHELRNELHDHE